MPFYKKYDVAEEKTARMKEKLKCEEFDESYIRELVGSQKGELSVHSRGYYKGNIAEGNWSQIEDTEIEKIDKDIFDSTEIIEGETEFRTKNSEYSYIFVPSYYAVMTLILYYLKNKKEAERIYGLKNAVVRRDSKKTEKFYGGLPFILKYMKKLSKGDPIRTEFAEIMEELIDRKVGLEINNCNDEFINDIVDCIGKSRCKDFILEKRIKDFKDAKDEYFCIEFSKKVEKEGKLLEDIKIDDYRILMHRDVEKDWKHLKEGQVKKANEIIDNTPNFPKNTPPKNDPLKNKLKGWFSQRVSEKDRVVYKKEEKVVYIATVCDHYKDAERRSKAKELYR